MNSQRLTTDINDTPGDAYSKVSVYLVSPPNLLIWLCEKIKCKKKNTRFGYRLDREKGSIPSRTTHTQTIVLHYQKPLTNDKILPKHP